MNITQTIEFGRKLHGHVGPYLVIGVKMGLVAKKALGLSEVEQTQLRAIVNVPLVPPFSCLLDGIQVSTTCTVGNQRLQTKNAEVIKAVFSTQTNPTTVQITLTREFTDLLAEKLKQDKLDEPFAWELADKTEGQLFDTVLKYHLGNQ